MFIVYHLSDFWYWYHFQSFLCFFSCQLAPAPTDNTHTINKISINKAVINPISRLDKHIIFNPYYEINAFHPCVCTIIVIAQMKNPNTNPTPKATTSAVSLWFFIFLTFSVLVRIVYDPQLITECLEVVYAEFNLRQSEPFAYSIHSHSSSHYCFFLYNFQSIWIPLIMIHIAPTVKNVGIIGKQGITWTHE